ncbi:hypothetical protein IFU39_00065 [Paenibacillus sp. CFBP 13594]|uniref:hypothetical protein n=1 Tax=Paenibacillus sp. CFBP 13594 TaxID=2774037 RepID=UPI0017817BB5|nr:hypothetical protein [Paenibacillus sp. CFBP 13594]MBD8836212.1 hypothetical protein [Paenibacillus sp. CFBP 13594]
MGNLDHFKVYKNKVRDRFKENSEKDNQVKPLTREQMCKSIDLISVSELIVDERDSRRF